MLVLISHKSSTEFKVLLIIFVGSLDILYLGFISAPLQNCMVLQQRKYSHTKISFTEAELNLKCAIPPETQFLTSLPIYCLNCIDLAFSKINALEQIITMQSLLPLHKMTRRVSKQGMIDFINDKHFKMELQFYCNDWGKTTHTEQKLFSNCLQNITCPA